MAKTKKKTVATSVRRNSATRSRARVTPKEVDSVYFLKLALLIILGSIWLRIDTSAILIPLPIGLIIGVIFASHERFKFDRKMEYALLLVSAFVGFWLPLGINIAF